MFGRFTHARAFKQTFCNQSHNATGGGGSCPPPPPPRPPWSSTNIKDKEAAQQEEDSEAKRGNRKEWRKCGRWSGEDRAVSVEAEDGGGSCAKPCPWRKGIQWGSILAVGFHVVHNHPAVKSVRERECISAGKRFSFDSGFGSGVTQLGALPVKGVSPHSQWGSIGDLASHLKAFKVEEILDLIEEEKKAAVEVKSITAPSDPTPSSPTKSDVNSSSFIERDLRLTHDLFVAQMEADLGLQLLTAGDQNAGMSLLKSAAKAGNAEAAHNLGVAYLQANDMRRSVRHFRKAARADYVPSLVNLAMLYEKGMGGIEKDKATAEKLFQRAKEVQEIAEQKEARKIESCESCQENGWAEGSVDDHAKVVSNPESVYRLARAYHHGLAGCPVDRHYAMALYKSAANGGHLLARQELEMLWREFEGDQVESDDETSWASLPSVAETVSPLNDFNTYLMRLSRRVSGDSGLDVAEPDVAEPVAAAN